MKSFTRAFFVAFAYTITNKVDKELSPQMISITQGNSTMYVLDSQASTWPTVFWPFWIYISLFLILSLTSVVLFVISSLKYCSLLISNEVDLEAIKQDQFGMSKRRTAKQFLFQQRGMKGNSEQSNIELMVAMTNNYDFAVSFFKVRRKINCKSRPLHNAN